MKTPINESGKRYGRLVVLNYTHSNKDKKACWDCKCDCGNIHNATGKSLRSGKCKSCGCLADETRGDAIATHGYCRGGKRAEYHVWRSMKERCSNPNNKQYSRYGGRGIKICKRWFNSFAFFIKDMGDKPSPGMTIERINNNGGYNPKNCKWATWSEQQNNKSTTRFLVLNGRKETIKQWSEITRIPYQAIVTRLYRGWSEERTLTQKLQTNVKRK
jgi:hypothetical protein